MNFRLSILLFVLFVESGQIFSQDQRAQIPSLLQKAYFEVNIGSVDFPFQASSLEPGFSLVSVQVPHPAVRLVLFGYEFNKYLSAQLSYMRPVSWVRYRYSGTESRVHERTVWMNVGGLTLKPTLPLGKRWSVYGEAGLGLITRHGFSDPYGVPVVLNAQYGTFLWGAGLKYKVNNHWDLQLCSDYSPANITYKQPSTTYIGAGFVYKFGTFNEKQLQKTAQTGFIYPKQWLQIGYTSNLAGYGINNAITSAYLFWGGDAEVKQGISINYQRNIFHGAKIFALDWGINASYWQTKGRGPGLDNPNKETFFTLSVFPVFRLNFLHSKPLDAYFYYSVAGPTYISKIIIDGNNTGDHFTFQDTMGAGAFFGVNRNFNAELKIGHYSNGNTFPHNDAVKIPLSLLVGYSF